MKKSILFALLLLSTPAFADFNTEQVLNRAYDEATGTLRVTLTNPGGGGDGAPTDAQYYVAASDSDLTNEIVPAANVQSILGAADYSAVRTLLGLVIGTNVQAYDSDLDDLADGQLTLSKLTLGNSGRLLIANAGGTWTNTAMGGDATMNSSGTLTITETELAVIRGLTSAADKLPYFTGSGTGALADYNAHARDFTGTAGGDDQVWIGDNATSGTPRTLADCDDSGGNHVNYDTATNTWSCGTSSSGAGGWTDSGTLIYNTLSSDEVTVGSTTSLAQFAVDGMADKTQALIQGHSTQTALTFVVEQNDGDDLMSVSNTGTVTTGLTGSAATITMGTAAISDDQDGAIFLGSVTANGSNENIIINFDDTSNTGVFTSQSGLTLLDFGAIGGDFDSGTLKIPAAAAPTISAAGHIGMDTTNDQLKVFGAAARVYSYKADPIRVSYTSPTTSDAFLLFKPEYNITITDIHCIVDPADGSESAVIDIQECNSSADSCATVDAAITCDNDGAEDDGSFSNATVDAGDWILLDGGTVTGTVSNVGVTIYYTVDAT